MAEWYALVLLLGSALVFVPGSTVLRPVIRGLPYAVSLGILVWYLSARSRRYFPPIVKWIVPTVVLYVANMFHPLTDPLLGVGVIAFQLAILGPVFWIGGSIHSADHLERLLLLIWGMSLLNAIVGVLQAAFPLIFMPPDFYGHQAVIAQQTYTGPFGKEIVRPPGLSDLPGAASSSGAVVTILGLALAVRKERSPMLRGIALLSVPLGLFVLYLTQVRVFALLTIFGVIVFGVIAFYQGRGRGLFTITGGVALLVLLAGLNMPTYNPSNPYAPSSRFAQILERGLFESFMENRGIFLVKTFDEYLWKYPVGAGLGRWGIIREYFGKGSPFSQIWVEIQPTGWLLDGGVLMWIVYPGALVAAMLYALSVALRRRDRQLSFLGATVLGLQVVIVGSGLAGPVFNTVFGILFWMLTAGLYAVVERSSPVPKPRVIRAPAAVPILHGAS